MENIYTVTTLNKEFGNVLRSMPKIELHVHLEGATDAATIWELARRNKIALPASSLEEWQTIYTFRDFDHFIEIYLLAASWMRTPDDFAFMVEQFIERQAKQNIRYCEVFLSASFMLDKLPPDELISALSDGAERGETRYGTGVRFIPDVARELADSRHRILDFALSGQERGIFIGLGLGGKEIGFPPEFFADVFADARRNGLHVVAHAGETNGPDSIWGALNSLKVERIGHGVRALEDALLINELRQTQIPLEVSPHSNYCLKVVPLNQPHPIRALMEQGLYVTLNSDDPPMFSTNLTQEYYLLAKQGWTWDELWQLNLNALETSFLSDEEKANYSIEWQSFITGLQHKFNFLLS